MSGTIQQVSGGCYCRHVRYRASDVSRQVTECHCSQCRKQAGHRYASTGAKTSDIEIDGAANITWYRATLYAKRGFCSTCGSALFWDPIFKDTFANFPPVVGDSITASAKPTITSDDASEDSTLTLWPNSWRISHRIWPR